MTDMAAPVSREVLVSAFEYLAEDLAAQGLKAHLTDQPQQSAALYGFSAAIGRTLIDVLGEDATPHEHHHVPSLFAKLTGG